MVGCSTLGAGFASADGELLAPSVTVAPPDTSGCQQKTTPPSAVDTSEAVAPGETAPEPLPVPEEPVGGPAMGNCDFLLPTGAAAVPSDISAHSWMVADLTTGQVLGGKDVHGRYRPASTLKLLLVQVVMRNLTNLDQQVVGTFDDADQEGSRVGIGEGGTYSVRDLLLGLLLNSGNDAANALARANGGTEKTLDEMNTIAASLGALDTRAATVSGLDGPGQQTSAYDLALIMQADLQLSGFAALLGTETATFPGYGEYPAFGIANENKLLANYDGAIGGKTGFTNDAGNTFVGVAQRGADRLVVTMLGGTQEPRRQWMQAASLLDWGFAARHADLNPVGRLVEPGADLDASSAASSAAASSAASASAAAPLTTAVSSAGGTGARVPPESAVADSTTGGNGWIVWVLIVVLLVAAALWWWRRRSAGSSGPADPAGSSEASDTSDLPDPSASGDASASPAAGPLSEDELAAEQQPKL